MGCAERDEARVEAQHVNSHVDRPIWEWVGRLPEHGSEDRASWEWVGVLERIHTI